MLVLKVGLRVRVSYRARARVRVRVKVRVRVRVRIRGRVNGHFLTNGFRELRKTVHKHLQLRSDHFFPWEQNRVQSKKVG